MTELAITAGLWVLGLAALARGYRPTGGTTLRAVWCWAVVALFAVAAGEAAAGLAGPRGARSMESVRFIAAVATLCPLIALLGAKRPQDRAWQLIVVSFWGVLALPAAQNLMLHPDAPLTVHPVWSWFMAGLILVGLTNYLPTRNAPAATLGAVGQWLLLARQLPGSWLADSHWARLAGLGLMVAALCVAAWLRSRRALVADPLDRLWLDFRDQFGVVWSLRLAERINTSAAMHHWGVKLTWYGFTPTAVAEARDRPAAMQLALSPPVRVELEKSLRSLLRRFVSNHWIQRRLRDSHASQIVPLPEFSYRPNH